MFSQNRESREQTLDLPGSFERLVASAKANSQRRDYWHGRVTYYYLGSAERNFREKGPFKAFSRGFYAIRSLIAAGRYVFSKDFWQGMTKPHYPRVWLTVNAAGKALFTNTEWTSV
jgi:hypothetical protein